MHEMTTRARARKLAIRSMLTIGAVTALIASGATASEAKSRKQLAQRQCGGDHQRRLLRQGLLLRFRNR